MSRAVPFWKIHWPTTAFAAVFLPVFIGLGCWQLQRAEEKRTLEAQFEQRRALAPVDLSTVTPPPDYTPVRLYGHFDNEHHFLLDNRISSGRFGYEVLTPFQPEHGGTMVLVNRGWISGDPARRQLPVIEPIAGPLEVTGYVHHEDGGFRLGEDIDEPGWPKVRQQVDIPDMQRQLGAALAPFLVRIDHGVPGAFRAQWPIVNMRPETHTGYAVQWFALAIALVLAWLFASTNLWQILRRQRSDEH